MDKKIKTLEKAKTIYEKIYIKAKEKNIDEVEVFVSRSAEEEFRAREHTLDTFVFAENIGASVRLIKDGRVGTSYTERLEEKSIYSMFDNAYQSIEYAAREKEYNTLPLKQDCLLKEENYMEENVSDVNSDKLKNEALEMEDILYKKDKRITNVPYSFVSRYSSEHSIINSGGIAASERRAGVSYYAEIIAEENGIVKTGSDGFTTHFHGKYFSMNDFASRITEDALSKLSAKPLKSGNYAAIFDNNAIRILLSSYLSVFFSDCVQKKLSLFQNKLGQKVANECVSLLDKPYIEDGLGNVFFDGEGVAAKEINLIENGTLQNFLYNTYTAKKGNCQTTGHANRGSYKSSIGITTHNVILVPGKKMQKELISALGSGIMVVDLMGAHAGVNSLSGDFSLQAEGYKIENGKIAERLSPFIVSGNILTLLTGIKEIGSDVRHNRSSLYTPSVIIENLSFSAE